MYTKERKKFSFKWIILLIILLLIVWITIDTTTNHTDDYQEIDVILPTLTE